MCGIYHVRYIKYIKCWNWMVLELKGIQFEFNQNCCDKNNNDNCRQSSSQSIKLI